jgi:hypothetical protein
MSRLIERLLIVVAALALSVGVIAVLSGGLLAGRDNPGVSGGGGGPGVQFRDQGDAHLRPGEPAPVYDSDPPTSGPHVPTAVSAELGQLTNAQLLTALELGNVVVMYGTRTPPAGLVAFARSVAAPFTPALAGTGQALILAPRAGLHGLLALAWTHMLRASSASDPVLRDFATFWLGRGASGG